MSLTSRSHWFGVVAGLFLAAGLVLSAMLVTRTWQRVAESQVITVTGSARRTVRSDLIVWSGHFSVEARTLLEAQQALRNDLGKVEGFLRAQQVTNHTASPISIIEIKARDRNADESSPSRTIGYRLTQFVEVVSPEVLRVAALDQLTTQLVEQGVLFTSASPRFIYTRAGDTKLEMLAEATRDAHLRAEQIASEGKRRVKDLRAARMGVFQITPLHSSRTSWEGENDTSSLEKSVTAVVNATFSMN